MRICEHCGASWDDRHEMGNCPVLDATARILDRGPGPPWGALTVNGSYVGRWENGWVGGRLFADEDGVVRWEADR